MVRISIGCMGPCIRVSVKCFLSVNHRLIFIVIYIRSAQIIGIQLKIAPAAASGVSRNVDRACGVRNMVRATLMRLSRGGGRIRVCPPLVMGSGGITAGNFIDKLSCCTRIVALILCLN